MGFIIELRLDLVTRTARADHWVIRFAQRVAALDHETFDDPVEGRPVIESLAREFFEVLDCFWRDLRPKLHDHLTFGGFNHRHFIIIHK